MPENLRIVAVHGQREGMLRYCPNASLSRESLDLIDLPGDSLAALALLPSRPVEVGEEWTVPDWAVQMFTATDAILNSEMRCTLTKVEGDAAHVSFHGQLEGARLGAHTKVELKGTFVFDLNEHLIRHMDMEHDETAGIGVVTPGLESKVRVTLDRMLAAGTGRLTNELIVTLPLDPPASRLSLVLDAEPWGVRLHHDRQWHVFHTSFDPDRPVIILRLLDKGSLISQCNVSLVPPVEAGQHTSIEEFEKNITQSLGDQFRGIVERGRIPAQDGRIINRVIAQGQAQVSGAAGMKPLDMNWVYYLVTHPSGRQVSFVFAMEPEQARAWRGSTSCW